MVVRYNIYIYIILYSNYRSIFKLLQNIIIPNFNDNARICLVCKWWRRRRYIYRLESKEIESQPMQTIGPRDHARFIAIRRDKYFVHYYCVEKHNKKIHYTFMKKKILWRIQTADTYYSIYINDSRNHKGSGWRNDG